MNRLEVIRFLESFFAELKIDGRTDIAPFLKFILSLKQNLPLSISLLREIAFLAAKADPENADSSRNQSTVEAESILKRRIDRRYARLCRIQEELGRLDLKNASPGTSPEDFIFSQIDFTRYREIDEKEFEGLFAEGLKDFSDSFFLKNFGRKRAEVQSVIKESYKKTTGTYRIQREDPLILSIMRTLETSLETLPLFTFEEIQMELKNLLAFLGKGYGIPDMELLYPLLVSSLDSVQISHEDGMTTNLFISAEGSLSGTFRPGNKPWTVVLIPVKS